MGDLYDEVDELVLDLLGRDSPLIQGLGNCESDPIPESSNQAANTSEWIIKKYLST